MSLALLKQPKPFYMIFFIEAWERFGYYGMQAILVLYLVRKFGMNDAQSFNTYSAFTALLYALVSIGGYIGDNIIGTKRTIVLGAIILALGYLLLGMKQEHWMYLGMGVICVGNGLFKANPSSLLSKCYKQSDPRIDGAFTLYYMAINLGSLVSMILVPIVAQRYGWSYGFWLCGLGLVLAIINFFMCYGWVKHIGSPVGLQPMNWLALIPVILGSAAVAYACSWILKHLTVAHWLLFVIGIAIVLVFLLEIGRSKGAERAKMTVALVLMIEAIAFFVLYQQMPTSLNFFALNNVEHSILGIAVNPLSFQALSPFWILLASPVLAILYNYYGQKGRDLSMPTKFAVGMFLCAFGFLSLYVSQFFANAQGIVSSGWIILSYFFQSVGELLVSGLGLAMVARLVPQRLVGFTMGAWFMTTAAALVIGGFVASMTSVPKTMHDKVVTLHVYTHVFLEIGVVTLLIAITMAVLVPKLNRLTSTHDKVQLDG